MKNWMKYSALMLALVMMMSMFAACGGGSSSSSDSSSADAPAEAEKAAEPNSGVSGIVFAIPEDWQINYAGEGIVSYKPNDNVTFWASTTSEEALKDIKEYNKNIKAENLEDYYQEIISNTEELKKTNAEVADSKVGSWDAKEVKSLNEAGEVVGLASRWLYDGKMYALDISSRDMYDDKGDFNKNSSALGDDTIAMFEDVLASVKEGDGEALKMSKIDPTTIGELTFEAPEGYKLESFSDAYVGFKKEGSNIQLSINRTIEDDLQYYTDEEGNAPQSLQEEYNNRLHEGVETTMIAGYEGYKYVNNYMDDKAYFCDAGFLADDALYTLHFGGNAWDENGNLRDDAEALTDEDKAVFDKFLESIKKK